MGSMEVSRWGWKKPHHKDPYHAVFLGSVSGMVSLGISWGLGWAYVAPCGGCVGAMLGHLEAIMGFHS
jgi:hypothetical protein